MEEYNNNNTYIGQQADIQPDYKEKNTKNKLKIIILIIVSIAVTITLIVFLISLLMYIKNASFKNNIQGTYICTEVGSTYTAQAQGYTVDFLEDYYLGTTITVDSIGYIRDIKGFYDSDFKLVYRDDYFDVFNDSYIYYLPEGHKTYEDFSKSYEGVLEVYYSKEGSKISADRYADADMLEIYCKPEGYSQNDSGTWFAFHLTFEKIR